MFQVTVVISKLRVEQELDSGPKSILWRARNMESSCYHVNIPKNNEEKNQSMHFSFLANELQMAHRWCS